MPDTEIALFPIPELVAFPGTTVPLHVFEPRYRTMVRDAVRDERLIGVCHTRKQINPGKQGQSLSEALSSNQATYLPCEVFSAGRVEVVETTDDGRIHANIHIIERYRISREIQTLPYRIVAAEVVADEDNEGVETADRQARVNEQLVNLVRNQNPRVASMLEEPEWIEQSAAEYTFRVFQFLRFDPEVMQTILESRHPEDRLSIIAEVLSQST